MQATHLPPGDLIALDAALSKISVKYAKISQNIRQISQISVKISYQQAADVVASLPTVQQLLEHLDT